MEECSNFINERREARHWKTMAQQKRKIESLCHKSFVDRGGCSDTLHGGSNNTTQSKDIKKWVINISDKALTEEEEKLLAHGPNYAIVPRNPPVI